MRLPTEQREQPRAGRDVAWRVVLGPLALALALLGFLVLKLFALKPHLNDDGIYFYDALALTRGVLPYRDIFFAHPPLHLVPTALVFLAFGYNFVLGKLVVIAAAIVVGLCVYQVTHRRIDAHTPATIRAFASLLAAVLLMFSGTFLAASSDDTGLLQATALGALAAVQLARGAPALAGLLLGCAVMISLLMAPLIPAFVLAAAWRERRGAFRFVVAAGALLLAVHAVGLAIGGQRFVQQVYLFHLHKPPVSGEAMTRVREFLVHDWLLVSLGLLGLSTCAWVAGPSQRLAAVLATAVGPLLLLIVTRPQVHFWYFVPLLPPLAIAAGWGLALLLTRAMAPGAGQGARRARTGTCGLLLGALALGWCTPASSRGLESPHLGPRAATVRQYRWSDAEPLGPANTLVRRVLWRDGVRRNDHLALSATEYLWRQSQWLDTFPAMVASVRALVARCPRAGIGGDYATTPLLALESGIAVAAGMVDTTGQRFDSGHADTGSLVTALDGMACSLVLIRVGGSGLSRDARFGAFVRAAYREEQRFMSRDGVLHILLSRGFPPGGGPS